MPWRIHLSHASCAEGAYDAVMRNEEVGGNLNSHAASRFYSRFRVPGFQGSRVPSSKFQVQSAHRLRPSLCWSLNLEPWNLGTLETLGLRGNEKEEARNLLSGGCAGHLGQKLSPVEDDSPWNLGSLEL
jgi:hypothetical protein